MSEKKFCGVLWHEEFILGPKNKVLRVFWLLIILGALVAPPLMLATYNMDRILQ